MEFVVLGSGSAGNASFVRADGFGLLIDAGFGPRQMESRLRSAGLTWAHVRAVLLTHTHGDHWNERTLARLVEAQIPLYCHWQHERYLHDLSPAFSALVSRQLVHHYEPGAALELTPQLSCLPFRLHHDSVMTCGFRFEGPGNLFGQRATLAYCADLGTWDQELIQLLTNVDVLALEFNHDVLMQRGSGRSPRTIARNLGNLGHLSNAQAVALLAEVLGLCEAGRPQHLVQLHLSRQCNRPELALGALQSLLATIALPIQVHTARQERAGPRLAFGAAAAADNGLQRKGTPLRKRLAQREAQFEQPLLPGWES